MTKVVRKSKSIKDAVAKCNERIKLLEYKAYEIELKVKYYQSICEHKNVREWDHECCDGKKYRYWHCDDCGLCKCT